MNLKQKAINGALWSGTERALTRGTQFIVTIILARLLTPADYGLIGMMAIFMAIAQSLINSGFGQALIQKKDADSTDFSTVFYFNIVVSVLIYLILFVTAPLIADFYEQTKLIQLARVMGLNFIINAFGLIQTTILTKSIDFKTQTKISFISIITSGLLGISLAYMGWGVWALVFQVLCKHLLHTVFLWVFNSWRPLATFSYQSFKDLFSFGSKLLLAGLLDTVFKNIYLLIIGKYFSAVSLGFYTQAKRLQELPVLTFTSIIRKVTFPTFSQIQDDNAQLKIGYQKSLKVSAFIIFPLMVGLAVVAEPFVLVVLTEKWKGAIPFIQILSIAGMLYPIHALNVNILQVKGRSDLFLRLELIKKGLTVIAIIISIQWGVIGLVIGGLIVSVLALGINTYYSAKMIQYPFSNQIADLFSILLISIAMAIGIYGLTFIITDMLVLLLSQTISGLVLYFLISWLFKMDALMEIIEAIKPYSPLKMRTSNGQ